MPIVDLSKYILNYFYLLKRKPDIMFFSPKDYRNLGTGLFELSENNISIYPTLINTNTVEHMKILIDVIKNKFNISSLISN